MRILPWREITARLASGGYMLRLVCGVLLGHLVAAIVKVYAAFVFIVFIPTLIGDPAVLKAIGLKKGDLLNDDLLTSIIGYIVVSPITIFYTGFYMAYYTVLFLPIMFISAYVLKLQRMSALLIGTLSGLLAAMLSIWHSFGYRYAIAKGLPSPFTRINWWDQLPTILAGLAFAWVFWSICIRKAPTSKGKDLSVGVAD